MTGEKKFPREKIMTCSARAYVESIDKSLKDYELIGLPARPSEQFISNIPRNAEAVVDFRHSSHKSRINSFHPEYFVSRPITVYSGTALVPKNGS